MKPFAAVHKGILTALLATMAAALIWYGIVSNRMAVRDLSFIQKHASTRIFWEGLLWKGNHAYYNDLDPAAAAACYRRAISMQPIFIDAWLALAKVELAQGRLDEARKIAAVVSPLIAHVSTWKWQEILLAHDLGNEEHFAACFNFILTRLPHRTADACFLAARFWDDWENAFPHVAPENYPMLLTALMRAKGIDAALSLWRKAAQGPISPSQEQILQFCRFLLSNDRVPEAAAVWKQWRGNEDGSRSQGVHDGGFEREPLNTAFGWHFKPHPSVTVERTSQAPYEGASCLHLQFHGSENIQFNHVSQVTPVTSGADYVLRFAQKCRNLTTDQGVFLELTGYRCKGLRVQSKPVTGTIPWKTEELYFRAPENCEAVTLQVRRKESLMFDNKISGDYWLDGVVLSSEQ